MENKYKELIKILNPDSTKLNEPMSKHTTVKIGGPADIWFEPKTNTELISAVKFAKEIGIPVTVIGGGSNILVGEKAYVAWLLGTIVRV